MLYYEKLHTCAVKRLHEERRGNVDTHNGSWRPWTGYIPTREEMAEQEGRKDSLPRVHPIGWHIAEYPNGTTVVYHLREIEWIDHRRVEIYEAGVEGPVYDRGYWLPRMRPISAARAMAWFAANGLRPPVIGDGVSLPQEPDDETPLPGEAVLSDQDVADVT
jgi:hypothetical protein